MGCPIDQETVRKIVELRRHGVSQEDVMERLQVSRHTVNKYQEVSFTRAGGWPDDQVEILKKRWLAGDTASQIAMQLGVTRNAVLGKVYRLGLKRSEALNDTNRSRARELAQFNSETAPRQGRPRQRKPAPAPKPPPAPKPAKPPVLKVVATAPATSPAAPMVTMKPEPFKPQNPQPYMDRGRAQCSWPITIAGELMACCDPVSPRSGGRQWCEHHTRKGQTSPNTQQKRKARGEIDRRTGAMRQWA